jgi:hypothetical protein
MRGRDVRNQSGAMARYNRDVVRQGSVVDRDHPPSLPCDLRDVVACLWLRVVGGADPAPAAFFAPRDSPAAASCCRSASVVVTLVLVLAAPVVWRSSEAGIERIARRLCEADVSVVTTLINYELLGPQRHRGPGDRVPCAGRAGSLAPRARGGARRRSARPVHEDRDLGPRQ